MSSLACLLLPVLVLLACNNDTVPGPSVANPPLPMPPSAPPVPAIKSGTYLALGDSYTIGERVPEADRWSVQLTALLRSPTLVLPNPDIIARTGWTTAELLAAIRTSGNTKTYNMVSLLIGVNNQYRRQSLEVFRTEFRELLGVARSFTRNKAEHVFVLSIPDWGVSPAGANWDRALIASQIDAFNAVAAEECRKAGIVFIDITPISRTAATDPSLIASDDLHFSGKMYKQWADLALPAAKKILTAL